MMARLAKSPARKKPSVAIVGVGNCGSTLAWALHDAGFPVTELVVHHAATAMQKKLARDLRAKLVRFQDWNGTAAELVWICVGDDMIAQTAETISTRFLRRPHPTDDEPVRRMGHPASQLLRMRKTSRELRV